MPAVENHIDTNSLVKNSIIKVKTTIPVQTQINFFAPFLYVSTLQKFKSTFCLKLCTFQKYSPLTNTNIDVKLFVTDKGEYMKKFTKKKPLNSYCQPAINSLEKEKVQVRDYKHLSPRWLEELLGSSYEERQYLFMLYSAQGNKKLVKLLYEHSVNEHNADPTKKALDINFVFEGDSALTLAARKGDMATVKYLLENNINPDFVGADGKTALQTFAFKGMTNNCQYLLDCFANPNMTGAYKQSAIFDATINNQPEVIEILTAYGAELDAQNQEGNTPLIVACQSAQRQEALFKLLKLGADIEKPNKKFETPLAIAIKCGNRQFVDVLLKQGCNLDAKDINGTTPLMLAAKYGQKETLRVLLSKGADLTAQDEHGNTALDYAQRYKNPGSVDILAKAQRCLENGEDLSFFGRQNKVQNSCVK